MTDSRKMDTERWRQLHAKATGSYVVQIDIRELEFLCRATLHHRMLVDGIRRIVAQVSVQSDVNLLNELLLSDVATIEGSIEDITL